MRLLSNALLMTIAACSASAQTYTISTIAGGGLPVNIAAISASVQFPENPAVDKAGNVFFTLSAAVLRLDVTTGILTLAAGNGTQGFSGDNGSATSAQLGGSLGNIAVDDAGNLYISDPDNNRVRKVTNGVITTVAGSGLTGTVTQYFSGDNGPATNALLNRPVGVAVDSDGNLYIADSGNYRIRKVSKGIITTVAGDGTRGFGGDNGPATSAQFDNPRSLATDTSGNLYIADAFNNRIRKVSNGVITTIAGSGTCTGSQACGNGGDNGPATSAQLDHPVSIAVDAAGNLYIADSFNNRIRKVLNGVITTTAGTGTPGYSGDGGPATSAELSDPFGVAVDSNGNLYIADVINNRIRKVSNNVITTVAGNGAVSFGGDNGPAAGAQLYNPLGITLDALGNLYIADGWNSRVREVSNGVITTVAGSGSGGGTAGPMRLGIGVFVGDGGPATSALLNLPTSVAVDSAGDIYIADGLNLRVRKIAGGIVTTVAGDGGFAGLAVDSSGNLYIADADNSRILKISNGVTTTVAGNGVRGFAGDNGPATSAQLFSPQAIAVDSAGNLYIADTYNNRIRKVAGGVITTFAGSSASSNFPPLGDNGPAISAHLNLPTGVAVDREDNLFIVDSQNHRIRKISNGLITTIAGGGTSGADNGPATDAQLFGPGGIAVGPDGKVYVSDNNRIRVLTPNTKPDITANGIVPVYSSVSFIQQGSWASIYGSNLADETALWRGDFPTSLGGVSVTIDNKPAYLWFVSPFQINLQVPDDSMTGPVSVVVTTPSGTATSTVTLASYSPSFSLLGDNKHVTAEIATPNGSGAYASGTYDLIGPTNTFSFNTRPVKPGETLTVFGVGFGPTTPAVPAGKAFSGSAPTSNPVTITIGGVKANVSYSGITQAGLYQINVTVPNAASGDQPVQATVNGVQTPTGPVVTVQ